MIARGLYINIFDQVWTQKWSKWAKIMQKLDHTAQIGKSFGLGKVAPNQYV